MKMNCLQFKLLKTKEFSNRGMLWHPEQVKYAISLIYAKASKDGFLIPT